MNLNFDGSEALAADENFSDVVPAFVRLRQLRGGADAPLNELAACVTADLEVNPAITARSATSATEQP